MTRFPNSTKENNHTLNKCDVYKLAYYVTIKFLLIPICMPWHLGKNMCQNSHKFAMQYGKFYAQLSIW